MSYPNGPQPGGEQPQWGQPQTGGQPAQPQGQWGQPQTGGQPAQPQGQWGQPAGQQTWGQSMGQAAGGSGFDVKSVPWWQWTILGGWLVYLIGLSLPNLSASSTEPGYSFSDSLSGWHYNAHVFAFILVTLAVLAIVASWFMKAQLSGLGFPFGFVTGGLAALGAVLGLIAFIVNLTDSDSGYGIDVGPGVGTWISLLAILAIGAGAAFEIMSALKQPKSGASAGGQWGAGGGQWGQPAQAPQQQWGQPGQQQPGQQQWGQPGQPGQQQWGQPGQ